MAAKYVSLAQIRRVTMEGPIGALQDVHFKIGTSRFFFFMTKNHKLWITELFRLRNKFLRLRTILICILSSLFKFFSFLSKENFQLWVGYCCDMSRQWLFNTCWPDSRRVRSPQPVISTFGFIYFSTLPLCSVVIAAGKACSL